MNEEKEIQKYINYVWYKYVDRKKGMSLNIRSLDNPLKLNLGTLTKHSKATVKDKIYDYNQCEFSKI